MIRLATVFSGIGAIEHALKRMGIEHKIVFASDNGDVDIFKKKIDINFVDIRNELDRLKRIIDNIDIKVDNDYEYLTDLESHLSKINKRITFIQNENKNYEFDLLSLLLSFHVFLIHQIQLKLLNPDILCFHYHYNLFCEYDLMQHSQTLFHLSFFLI